MVPGTADPERRPFAERAQVQSTYATFGFTDAAKPGRKGAMWPTAFALEELTGGEEARSGGLVKKSGELRAH